MRWPQFSELTFASGQAVPVETFEQRNEDAAGCLEELPQFARRGAGLATEVEEDHAAGSLEGFACEHDVRTEFDEFAVANEKAKRLL